MTLSDPICPNLFIAGVPKAGTSSLHNWLAAHPDTLASRDKETCFFADGDSHTFRSDFNSEHGLEAYARQFDSEAARRSSVIFESTPTYIYQKTALRMIPDLPTRPRCLFVLREPAAQIRSIFTYYRNNWAHIPPDLDFHDYLARVRRDDARFAGNELAERPFRHARYLDFLIPWRDALGPDRMKVLTFEQVTGDPRGTMREIADWLDLDAGYYDDFAFRSDNESYQPRSRALQRINIALRGRLPKGRIYRALRAAYRGVNTDRPDRSPDAAGDMAEIRARMAPHNEALAEAFDLDLTGWS